MVQTAPKPGCSVLPSSDPLMTPSRKTPLPIPCDRTSGPSDFAAHVHGDDSYCPVSQS
jgi:hypothetical protein